MKCTTGNMPLKNPNGTDLSHSSPPLSSDISLIVSYLSSKREAKNSVSNLFCVEFRLQNSTNVLNCLLLVYFTNFIVISFYIKINYNWTD